MVQVQITKQPDRIKWYFPPTGGGIAQGFNDSSKEIFKANILEHAVREIIQNSLDAKKNGSDLPVIVKMEKIELTPAMINGGDLVKHVDKSLKRSTEQKNPKGIKFYRNAMRMLKKSKIPTLKIIDENTTGLNGRKWDALVHQEGTPSKDNPAAGGSYGIGKNAPYAASALSLMCYSTRYLNRHRNEKFIARCNLVAHEDPAKPERELQHVGFGTSRPFDGTRFQPIVGKQIRSIFRLKKHGSGIFIVGFTERNWQAAARRSIARNFFAAIHKKKLSVVVGDTHITNETLNEEEFGSNDHRHYYDLYKSTDTPIRISGGFGTFCLKILTGNETMSNRVAYINRRGMLITAEKTFRKNPFHARLGDVGKYAAVVWAADDRTDMRVRDMEPPTHETIEYERITEPAEQQQAVGDLREINSLICDHIKKKLNIDTLEHKTELTELSNIIPLVSDPNKDNANERNDNRELTNEPNQHIRHRKMPMPDSGASITGEGDGADGGSTTKHPGGGKSSKKSNKKGGRRITANMKNVRMVRHGDVLRVAFTPTTGSNKFVIRPAGEEHKVEEVISVASVKSVSPTRISLKIDKNTITVHTTKNRRVVLDISLGQALQYTGYNVVEYATRRMSK